MRVEARGPQAARAIRSGSGRWNGWSDIQREEGPGRGRDRKQPDRWWSGGEEEGRAHIGNRAAGEHATAMVERGMIAPRTVARRRHVRLPPVRWAVMVMGHGHGAGCRTLRTVLIAGDPRRCDGLL